MTSADPSRTRTTVPEPSEPAHPARPDGVAIESLADTPTPLPIPAPEDALERYEEAFAGVQAPFAFVDLDAVWSNAADMLRRANGKPIRIASKSVRCLPLLQRLLDLDRGFQGLLTYTLPETIWLWDQGMRDLVLAYPTADTACLTRLARITAEHPDDAPVVMVDSVEHLDMIEAAATSFVAPVRVAMDVDASWWPLRGLLKVGPKRSPIRAPEAAVALAREIERRERVKLVGLMAYEGQVAGVGDHVPGKSVSNAVIRAMQSASMKELRERRAKIVGAVTEVSEIEFVNGGGTGSIELTTAEPAVTEIAAGSGFYAPVLFDHYRSFRLIPAAMFALPVVRKPSPRVATALGGGYLASGVGAKDRMPVPHLPAGLRLDSFEGAGEVQTPLVGRAAAGLELGDRVYFRHAKAGELCERFNRLYLVTGTTIRAEVPTYRGQERAFL
ncbi:MAG TPA: amino acid deaminase/aldolase [Solirubrobacterales bacterium]|nr:amino acid deaminase/aldolase [Solirubrobacterales bacterium]